MMGNAMRSAGIFVLCAVLALPSRGAAPPDPFAGTWKLNTGKSKLPPGGPQSDTVHIEIDGLELKIAQEGTTHEGLPFKLTVLGGLDDSIYGIKGCVYADAVQFRRTSPRRILAEVKKSGGTVATLDAEVSGNSIRINLLIVDAEGKESKSVVVLQRE
jgi:hypothetical protein